MGFPWPQAPTGTAEGPSTSTAWAPSPPRSATKAAPPSPNLDARRALPTTKGGSRGPDLVLLLAAIAVIGAAVLAWQAVGAPWVRLVITDTSERLEPRLVGDITLRGQAALVGSLGRGLAVVIGVAGLLWLLYGIQRGATIPWFANPAFAGAATIIGGIGFLLSAELWFVWKEAAINRARAVRLSVEELGELLGLQPPPLVEIERLSGLLRFGAAMALGVLAVCAAWWAYNKRS